MENVSTKTTFRLEFEYLHKLVSATAYEAIYPNGYLLYKVNFKTGKYWFLKHSDGWKVFGDFKLNKRLERTIIDKLSQHTTILKGPKVDLTQVKTADEYIVHKTILTNQDVQDKLL